MNLPKSVTVKITAGVLAALTMASPAFAATGTVHAVLGLRLRSEANTTSQVLSTLPDGARVEVLDMTDTGWYQVAYEGKQGFLISEFVVVDEVSQEPETEEESAQETEQAEEQPQEWQEEQTWETEELESEDEIQELEDADQELEATLDELEDDGMQTAEELLDLEMLDEMEESVTAAMVFETQQGLEGIIYGKVTAGPLNVRRQPTVSSDSLKQLYAGAVVKINEIFDGWYETEDGGYVSSQYVQIIDSDEANVLVSSAGRGESVAAFARRYLGYRYVYGGTTPRGFDCSGFVKYVYANFGINLNRTASAQMSNGVAVSRSQLQPGDLVFFKSGRSSRRASQVGMYIGNGQFIHASTPTKGVIISSLNSTYYSQHFIGARHIL